MTERNSLQGMLFNMTTDRKTLGNVNNQRNVVSSKLFLKTMHDKGVSALLHDEEKNHANTRSPSPWEPENTDQSLMSNQEHVESRGMKATGKLWSNLKVV